MRIHRIVLAAILVGPIAGLLIACEGGGVRGDLPRIDTIPEISELRAGESVAIACEVRNGSGDLVDVPTTVAVEPEYGLTLQKKVATFTVTGTFRARCAAPSMGLTDDTPAQILVTPADPATSEAILDPDTVPAGTPSQVSCLVRDAFGNLIPDALTTVEGDDGLTINGALVSATLVGSYDVTCAVDGFDVTRTGDVLKVEPADPDRIVLTVAPSRAFYAVENTVKLTYKIYDAYDNRVPSARADLTYEPKANVRDLGGGEIRFLQEGHTLATATVRPPFDHVSDSIMLACDQSAPVLDVLFPPRGHTQDGDPVLVVRGTVTDLAGSDITEITVNGEAATLHSDGRFEYPIQSMHGMNGLRISASDEHGFSTFTTRGYYYSTGWLDVPGNANLDDMIVSQAALLFLGQQALDDGDHDPARLNDMATIVEALLGLDFLDLLGGLPPFGVTIPNIINLTLLGFGIQGDLEVQVGFRDIVFGAPRVDLDSRDGGIDAGIGFRPVSIGIDLSFIIHARATGFGQSIPLLDPSTTTASSLTVGHLALAVSLDIDKPFGGELFVEGRDFDVILDEVSIDPIAGLWIDLGPIPGTGINLGSYDLSQLVGGLNNLLRDWVLNPLVNFVTPLLVDLLEPVVVPLLGDAVRQVLDLLSIRQAFELPALLGGSATSLELALDLSSITFTDDGGLVGLDLGFLAEDQVNMRTLGAIRRDGCMGTDPDPTVFDLGTEPSIQAGVRLDMVNELLFMVWRSGMLSQALDLGALLGGGGGIPVENLAITPKFYLPLILDDCGLDGAQEIQIGDLFLDVAFDLFGSTQYVQIWLQARIEANVAADGNQIGIRIGKVQFMEYELLDGGSGLGDLLGLVEGLIPGLLKMIEGQELMLPIPPIEVGGLIPGLPAGAVIELGDLEAGTEKGLLHFGGNLK